MITIIKHGNKEFKTVCSWCGCEFTYQREDVVINSVNCPDCGKLCYHTLEKEKITTASCSHVWDLTGCYNTTIGNFNTYTCSKCGAIKQEKSINLFDGDIY